MRYLALALLICGAANAQTAAMYRTVAPDGSVSFSDVPLSENSEMITVLVRASARQETEEPAAVDDAVEPDSGLAAQIEANCRLAREQQESIADSTRVYRVLPSGERQFLTDEEIAEAREQAAADVAQWCPQPG
ncbi:MAG TPA: DUF4124 domain-containing protein [Gammaproteobacteria bacterium]|nr:DUF4124 domain-containing protein [Gammaproteobacteria bacterium]